jgi:hypothetical protein
MLVSTGKPFMGPHVNDLLFEALGELLSDAYGVTTRIFYPFLSAL